MSDETTVRTTRWGHPAFWAVTFALLMIGISALQHRYHMSSIAAFGLIALASLTLYPMIRGAEQMQRDRGALSTATQRYNRRAMVWAFGYVFALSTAMWVKQAVAPTGPLLWLIAILPSLPILFLVWSMGRYFIEETDEYQRMRQMKAGLIATGLLLTIATFWGFLETFGVAPHADAWWAVPIWAMGLGLGQFVTGRMER